MDLAKGKERVPINLNIDLNRSLRVLQVTDCHLELDADAVLLGLNVEQSFRDVLAHMIESEPCLPDLLLVTGDISGDYSSRSYQRFHSIVREYLPETPMACLAGNHDLPRAMAAALPSACLPKSIILGDWMVYMLDSSVEGCIHGDICSEELEWLDRSLSQNSDKHAMVCVHHQPVQIGCDWIDEYIIRSADGLLEILDRHTNVKSLVWGHVHQVFEGQRKHYRLMSTPATSIQFEPNSGSFTLARTMPGYRRFELSSSGELATSVVRIPKQAYNIDYSSEGY